MVEIENLGPVPAVDISLTLIERVKRPSGKLSVRGMLKAGEKTSISAYDYPETLEAELGPGSFEEIIRNLDGEKVRIPPTRIARYLLLRDGGQLLVMRYRTPDSARQMVRLFSVVRLRERFPSLKLNWGPLVRLYAKFLEWRFRRNSVFAPPSKVPSFLSGGEGENTRIGNARRLT
jgi:hypothetical protein